MRPLGTNAQLAARRKRALQWLRRGQTATDVAKRVGRTARSIRRWQHEAQPPQYKPTVRRPGRPARLSARQLRRLERALQRGAYGHGYAEDYWTLERIARVIWDLFHVRYHASAVWHLLRRMGWSCQKPQRQPLQRDDEAVRHWKRYTWPQIKKVA